MLKNIELKLKILYTKIDHRDKKISKMERRLANIGKDWEFCKVFYKELYGI